MTGSRRLNKRQRTKESEVAVKKAETMHTAARYATMAKMKNGGSSMQIHVTDAAKHTLQQAMDVNPGKSAAPL